VIYRSFLTVPTGNEAKDYPLSVAIKN
jgi:hypothetical protein